VFSVLSVPLLYKEVPEYLASRLRVQFCTGGCEEKTLCVISGVCSSVYYYSAGVLVIQKLGTDRVENIVSTGPLLLCVNSLPWELVCFAVAT
jgi:hypothetical protein